MSHTKISEPTLTALFLDYADHAEGLIGNEPGAAESASLELCKAVLLDRLAEREPHDGIATTEANHAALAYIERRTAMWRADPANEEMTELTTADDHGRVPTPREYARREYRRIRLSEQPSTNRFPGVPVSGRSDEEMPGPPFPVVNWCVLCGWSTDDATETSCRCDDHRPMVSLSDGASIATTPWRAGPGSQFLEDARLEPAPEPDGGNVTTTTTSNRWPIIVCLIGSTRHWDAIVAENARQSADRKIVLVPQNLRADTTLWTAPERTEEREQRLHEARLLHLAKIRLADEILVVNPDGRLGHSTLDELKAARMMNKKVDFLSEPAWCEPLDLYLDGPYDEVLVDPRPSGDDREGLYRLIHLDLGADFDEAATARALEDHAAYRSDTDVGTIATIGRIEWMHPVVSGVQEADAWEWHDVEPGTPGALPTRLVRTRREPVAALGPR